MNWKGLLVGVLSLLLATSPAAAQSAQYGYDALGRLTSVTYSNGSSVTYAYDAAGNRTQVSSTVPSVSASLSASPTTINQGQSSTLTWSTSNATSTSISNGVGNVTPVSSGTVSVSPGTTTTYTLTATGPAGSATSQATVTVTPAPVTASLSASPTTITQGASTTLTWATTNATSASINNGVGTVTPVSGGSVPVSPSATTTYTLTATGPGGSATAPASVTVNDYSVTPWIWANISVNSPNSYGGAWTPSHTLSGFNQNITLRFQASGVANTLEGGSELYVWKNGANVGHYNVAFSPSSYVDVSAQPGDVVAAYVDGLASSTAAQSASGTVSVRNLSDGNALASSFNFNLALGPDYSVTPWDWGTQTINTTANFGDKLTPLHTLAGFNQSVTLRFQAINVTGGLSAASVHVGKNGQSAGSYNFIGSPSGYVDVTFAPGDLVHLYLAAQSWTGPATGNATVTVRNLSDSNTLVSSFTLNMAVDQ